MKVFKLILQDEYTGGPPDVTIHASLREVYDFVVDQREYLHEDSDFPHSFEEFSTYGWDDMYASVYVETSDLYTPAEWSAFCLQWVAIGVAAGPLGDEYLTHSQRG